MLQSPNFTGVTDVTAFFLRNIRTISYPLRYRNLYMNEKTFVVDIISAIDSYSFFAAYLLVLDQRTKNKTIRLFRKDLTLS